MNKKNIKIHIIGGTGKMGQRLKLFFEDQDISVSITDRNYLKKTELIKKADIIIISVPISYTVETIQNIIPFLSKHQLLTDIASVKTITIKAMEKVPCAALGMHPLFGPSIETLKGQKIVFCRQKDNDYVAILKNIFEKAEIEIIEMTADEHDYQMAFIQTLTHAVHLLYAKTLLDQKKEISVNLQTPTFLLHSLAMERILNQQLELSFDMEIYNPYFKSVLKKFIYNSNALVKIIEKKDKKEFVNFFSKQIYGVQNKLNISVGKTNKIINLLSAMPISIPQDLKPLNANKDLTISYLGPKYSYSYIAANKLLPENDLRKNACLSLYEVFKNTADGQTDIGVVPAENSIEGTIDNTLDFLADFPIQVIGSIIIPIRHQLLSREKKLSDITHVLSHQQALAQCRQFLNKNLPKAKIVPTSSTTAEISNEKKGYAFIASKEAANAYEIPIISQNIQDEDSNSTKFYIISKKPIILKQINSDKTLLFVTVYNRVGMLRDVLDIFAKNNINLTKLESRPSYQKLWDYHFFIEADIEKNDKKLLNCLEKLGEYCPTIKVLGQT